MKKLYTLFAAAALAMSANATIYVCGDGNDLGWTPEAPMVVELGANNAYTFTATNVASLKISTAFGDWDTFNSGAVCCELEPETVGTEVALVPSDGNIVLPWTGDWTFVVNADITSLTATTTTPRPEGISIYVRGELNGWGAEDAWKFTQSTEDPTVFTFNCTGDYIIPAGSGFKIADGSWGVYNYGPADAVQTPDEFGTEWNYNSQTNAMFEEDFEGVIEFHLPEVKQGPALVIFLENAGISNITIDNNAPREYFNLQGVRVANPENGLFIVRQGNKVSKVIVK